MLDRRNFCTQHNRGGRPRGIADGGPVYEPDLDTRLFL